MSRDTVAGMPFVANGMTASRLGSPEPGGCGATRNPSGLPESRPSDPQRRDSPRFCTIQWRRTPLSRSRVRALAPDLLNETGMRRFASLLRALQRRRRWFAVDVGSSAVKIAEVTDRGGKSEVVRAAALPVPPGAVENGVVRETAVLARAIRTFAAPGDGARPPVVASIPGRGVIIKRLELPGQTRETLDDVIEFEAMDAVPEDLGNVNLDYHVLGPSGDGSGLAVLLVAARKTLVENHIELLETAGLTPAIVDVDHFALGRLCEEFPAGGGTPSAWIHVGGRSTTVHVPAPDGPGYTTDLPVGGEQLTEGLAEKLSVPRDEAETIKRGGSTAAAAGDLLDSLCDSLAAQISRGLSLFGPLGHGTAPRRIALSGGSAVLPGLGPGLARALDAEVRVGGPFFTGTALTEGGEPAGPAFAVVAGLAARNPVAWTDRGEEDTVP